MLTNEILSTISELWKDAKEGEEGASAIRMLLAHIKELEAKLVDDGSPSESWWDANSVECGGCRLQLISRGGTGVGLSTNEGEHLCGKCAGDEIARLKDQAAAIKEYVIGSLPSASNFEFYDAGWKLKDYARAEGIIKERE